MSSIFFTADNHFGHSQNKFGKGGIIFHAKRVNPSTGKLFASIEEHDAYLIERWNNTVSSGDMVYILGDFCWKEHVHYIHALRGKKTLIKGSHDAMNQDALRLFSGVHEGMLIRNFNKVQFTLTHCCMRVWERSHYGSVSLYGHSHGRIEERDDVLSMDVGVDCAIDYAPWSLEFILHKMSLKKKVEHSRSSEELDAIVKLNRDTNRGLFESWKNNAPKI